MWDNPRLLNLATATMIALALLLSAHFVVRAVIGSKAFPLRIATMTGSVERLTREQVSEALNGRQLGNFFGADLLQVRDWIEELPWVRRAAVRRVWPDRLEIFVEEHRAMARWSDDRFVNTYGELFQVSTKSVPNATTLPRFAGPAEAVADIAQRYTRFASILAPLSTEIASLRLTPRLAWQIRLADGLAIEVGREHGDSTPEMRLARFVEVYPTQIATLSRRLKTYVDLRYSQGFAVRDPDIERRVQERLKEELNERNERGPLDRMRSAA